MVLQKIVKLIGSRETGSLVYILLKVNTSGEKVKCKNENLKNI